jgi:putative transcription factor
MNCELCGSAIRGEAQAINIDGGIFRVCNSCSRLGTPARVPKPAFVRPTNQSVTSTLSRPQKAKSPPPPSPTFSYDAEEMMLREDYSKVIKSARELLGITQEELGRKINEKPSVISHLEVGSMKPDDVLAKKLEHLLKIELYVSVEDGLASYSP